MNIKYDTKQLRCRMLNTDDAGELYRMVDREIIRRFNEGTFDSEESTEEYIKDGYRFHGAVLGLYFNNADDDEDENYTLVGFIELERLVSTSVNIQFATDVEWRDVGFMTEAIEGLINELHGYGFLQIDVESDNCAAIRTLKKFHAFLNRTYDQDDGKEYHEYRIMA